MALVHEQLYQSPDPSAIEIGSFLGQLCSRLSTQSQAISVDVPRLAVRASMAVNIGILVNELVTNALRHAYPENRSGLISVGASIEETRLRLWVSDDGKGLESDFDPYGTHGLGMRLVMSLPRSLGGETRWRSRPGETTFEIVVPLASAGHIDEMVADPET